MTYLNHSDDRLPPIPKESLQQYDNYQIYDLVCVDKPEGKFKNFLAIQAYSTKPINCDFITIANLYK